MRGRLVVVGYVYHQRDGEDPTAVECRFARPLSSNEQPYRRELMVGERWQPLDHGWLKRASMLVLANQGAAPRQRQPTAGERQEDGARVVEIGLFFAGAGIAVPFALVPPGESLPLTPADLWALRLRCRAGEARVVVTVFAE